MTIKKYTIKKFLVILMLTFFIVPLVNASANYLDCCHEEKIKKVSPVNCHDSFKKGMDAEKYDYECSRSQDSFIKRSTNDSDDTVIINEDNSRRFKKYFNISYTQSYLNQNFLVNNNKLALNTLLVAPPPQLKILSTILKRE